MELPEMPVLSDEEAKDWIVERFEDLISQSEFAGVYPTDLFRHIRNKEVDWHRQAQRDQTVTDMLRWFVEWGKESCPHASYRNSSNIILHEQRWYCKKCWQELKDKLAELGKE